MISDDFGLPPQPSKTQWSHNETIDVDDLRMFVNQKIQSIRELMERDFPVYYLRDMHSKNSDPKRIRGISPEDCKILAHDIIDFLIQDVNHPISVRKQCVEDSVLHLKYTVGSAQSSFIGDDGKLKPLVFVDHFIKACEENLYIFDCIEGRIQNNTSASKKNRM